MSKEWAFYIKELVKVDRTIKRFDTKLKKHIITFESSFYLSTKTLDIEKYAEIIRWHWAIENKNHYVKDVSLNEDKSRIRVNPDIFVILRSFALNTMRANNSTNIKADLYENSLNLDLLFKKYCYIF